jgi:putative addiction module component (TIGR02574 family)
MAATFEALQAEVLRLPPGQRARLLERLMASLDQDVEMEAAWDAEAARREAELDAGTVKPVPFEEAMARLEARFPG